MLQRFHCNDSALTTDDTNCSAYRDIGVRLADSFPEVTVNLDIAVASCLDDFRDLSCAS